MGDGNRHKKQPQKKQPPPTPPTPVSSPFPTHPTPPLSPVDRRAPPPTPPPLPRRPPARTIPTTITTPTESGGVLGGGGEEQPRGTGDGRTGSGSPDTHPTPPCLPPSGPPRVHPPAGYRDRTRRPPQPPQPPPTPQSRRAHTQAAEAERPRVIVVYVAAGQQTARDTPPRPVGIRPPAPRRSIKGARAREISIR